MTLKNVADVTALLSETINQVRSGELDARTSNAVGYLAAVMLKALQHGDIEARLQALEAVQKAKADKMNAMHILSPLKATGSGVWETTIPLTGDQTSSDQMFAAMTWFGFGVYV